MPNQRPSPTSRPALPRVGGYRLLARIGEGGMGVVHLAQAPDGSRVALKVLRPHVVGDDEARARLAREVGSLRLVTSPRVAEVLDADPWGETPYVATRYVPGLSLHEHIRQEGPITGGDLAYFAAGLLEAVIAVHQVGVLHRDIKPSNVLLEGRAPVLIDFGLARLAEDPRLTQTGFLLGTPGYLAPEILYGEDATTASDVHSWAATMVFAATGRPPFGTGPALAIMDRVRRGEHELSAVPSALLPLVRAALEPDPADRPSTMQLRSALLSRAPIPRPRALAEPEPDDYTMPFEAAPPQGPTTAATDVLTTAPTTPTHVEPAATRRLTVPLHQAARAPYHQPPEPRQRVRPVPSPDTGLARVQRRALLLGLFATATLSVARAPYLGLLAVAIVAWVLRTVAWTTESAHRRQQLRGRRRWYDSPLTAISAPWYLVVATAGTVALLVWSGLVALLAGFAYLVFGGPMVPGLVLVGAAATAALWWGPAARRLRTPTRRLLRAATRSPALGWCAVALVAAAALVSAYSLVDGAVVWDPAAGSPWRPGTLLGSVLRWL